MTALLYLALTANAASFSLIALCVLFDRAGIRKRTKQEEAARQAMRARIAELRKARQERERRHERRSEIDRELVLLTARSLKR